MKRFVGLILCLALLLGAICPVCGKNETEKRYREDFSTENVRAVGKTSDWAKGEVDEAVQCGLLPDTMYEMDLTQYIDREEFAAIAVKLYEKVTNTEVEVYACPFADISECANYESIKSAYGLGITAGTTQMTFEPYTYISREQLATMLCRVFKKYAWQGWNLANDNSGAYRLSYAGTAVYDDDDEISLYAKPAVYFMSKYGVINGVGNHLFAPHSVEKASAFGFATREQALLIALRCYKRVCNATVMAESRAPIIDEQAYTACVTANLSREAAPDFSQGIVMTDLNEDGIPELFALSLWQAAFAWFADVSAGIITDICFALPPFVQHTFYEAPYEFCGIYRNKQTNENVILSFWDESSDGPADWHFIIGRCDVHNKITVESLNPSDLDQIMTDYVLSDKYFCEMIVPHGVFEAEGAQNAARELMGETQHVRPKYEEAEEGELFCYVHDVQLDKGEIVLTPALEITLADYQNALQTEGRRIRLGGHDCCLLYHDFDVEEYGIDEMFVDVGFYAFDIPTVDSPVSVVRGYLGERKIKARFSGNFMITGDGIRDENGAAVGGQAISAKEYFSHYSKRYNNQYYKATLQSGELVALELIYRP